MKYSVLGNTGIEVSRLCFGALTIGPLQKHLPLNEGIEVLEYAIDCGVNFVDTADLYDTYPYIRGVIKKKPDLVVSTKSYAYNVETAEKTLNRALKGIDRDYVDLFLLHEQEGPYTLKGHREALEYFIKEKQRGKIRAVGISTHHIAAVEAASSMNEIDIIFPILNYRGLGIVDGSRTQMERAIEKAYKNGKGIYLMKPLGGGHLIGSYHKAMNYILDFQYTHSIAIGMQRKEEVKANIDFFNNRNIDGELEHLLENVNRKLIIQDWCQGCGKCVDRCTQGALYLADDGRAHVNNDICILCGYCGAECPEMAIKII